METLQLIVGVLIVAALSNVVTCVPIDETDAIKINTPQGNIRGKVLISRSGKAYATFLGVPYAQPPTENLRLKPPVEAKQWDEIRDARTEQQSCIRKDPNGLLSGSEDCLYVNVYIPYNAKSPNQKYPVIVSIRGNSWRDDTYSPEYVADNEVVLVTVSYRTGNLGFLSLENDVIAGNYGLKDQAMALNWVQKYIASYNGNPRLVTIEGEGDAAAYVALHLISPNCRGMFHRAISINGFALSQLSVAQPGSKRNESVELIKGVNCDKGTSKDILDCLQKIPVEELYRGEVSLRKISPYRSEVVVEPESADSPFLIRHPSQLIGALNDVPYLIGINFNEVVNAVELHKDKLVDLDENYLEKLPLELGYYNSVEPSKLDSVTNEIKQFYFSNRNFSELPSQFAIMLMDRLHLQPAIDTISRYPGPVYFYLHDYDSNDYPNELNNQLGNGVYTEELLENISKKNQMGCNRNRKISSQESVNLNQSQCNCSTTLQLIEYFIHFAKHGTPNNDYNDNSQKTIQWDQALPRSENSKYLYLNDGTAEMKAGFRKTYYRFWNDLIPQSIPSLPYSQLGPNVTIAQGSLRGKYMYSRSGRKFEAYLGIPYAEPPVGTLRLMPPKKAGNWTGERDASIDASQCTQMSTNNVSAIVGMEDCLYINVYVPYETRSAEKLYPVMVWIYGGALVIGEATSTFYGPQYLMDKDVIVVTFNYRLGLLGFLSLEDKTLPGNYGMKDQVLALQWVKENMKYFGGNSNDVTIFGESAGAVSTAMHLISPRSQGLFNRVISQSGTAVNFWSLGHKGVQKADALTFALRNKCLLAKDMIKCFQKLNAEQFVPQISVTDLFTILPYNMGIVREPEDAEDAFLTTNPWDELVKPRNTTWIVGVNSGEGGLIANPLYEQTIVLNLLDSLSKLLWPGAFGYQYTANSSDFDNITLTSKQYYFKDRPMNESFLPLVEIFTERAFVQPAIDSAKLYPGPKYFYYYDHVNKFREDANTNEQGVNYGASHGDDLFSVWFSEMLYPNGVVGVDKIVSEQLVEYWTNFAIYGTPNSSNSSLSNWDPVKTDAVEYLYINNGTLEMRSSLREKGYNLWSSFPIRRDF